MDKRIALYCVNYNSYDELHAFIHSVEKSVADIIGCKSLDIFIADNTEENYKEICLRNKFFSIHTFPFHKNLGYFGAVKKMMDETNPESFDFIIISNVDVVLAPDALQGIVGKTADYSNKGIGWIAPQIYSEAENRDRNPKIMNRYSIRKLKILRLLFKYPMLYFLYKNTAYKRKRYQPHTAGNIYGGHGSFIILTKEYIEKCGPINYPVFLFGEEIYLAEECRRHNLKVVYDPTIKVTDKEHASTGRMPSRQYNKFNIEALNYIIRTFY